MSVADGADEDDTAKGDDGVSADDDDEGVDAGGGTDAICTALVGDDADENAGAAGAAAGPEGIRSKRRSAPSEPML